MIKSIRNFALLLVGVSVAAAFSPKETSTYKVDPSKSTLGWTGTKVTGKHNGFIKLKEGQLLFDGETLKSGNFTIDMNSISCTDLTDPGYNEKLVGHLKSDDFFGVEKFPDAKLEIRSATPTGKGNYTIKGDLSIKGKTNPIEFPATVTIKGTELTAKSKIEVDRSKYDVRYGSGSFFDDLGDKAIDDIFVLEIELKGKK